MTIDEQSAWIAADLRRHVVSRRTALRGGLVGAGALALVVSPWSRVADRAFAAPTSFLVGRRLAYGPDPTRQMRVAGELTAALPSGAKLLVDYGSSKSYGATAAVEVRSLITQLPSTGDVVTTGSQQFFAHAALDHLAPGTTYHWRFRYTGATGESATADSTFTTAPHVGSRAPFTFTALGDQGIDDPAADATGVAKGGAFTDSYSSSDPPGVRRAAKPVNALVAGIAKEKGAFHLHTGDMCYADDQGLGGPENPMAPEQTYNPFTWTTYFSAIEPSAVAVPWMFSTGNHDMEVLYGTPQSGPARAQLEAHGYGGHAARLDLFGEAAMPSVYAFRYANVACIALDANDLSKEIPSNAGYTNGAQTTWLTTNLAAFRKDPTIDFIVVYFHHCAYSSSATHGSDNGVRKAFAPLFQTYGVDLVLQGHNHQFERTNPIKNGTSSRQAPDGSTIHPAVDGPTYVLCGSGGRPHYDFAGGERYRGHTKGTSTVTSGPLFVGPETSQTENVDWSQVRYARYAYLAVDVVPGEHGKPSTMTLRTINDLGKEIDRLTLSRVAGGVTTTPATSAAASGTSGAAATDRSDAADARSGGLASTGLADVPVLVGGATLLAAVAIKHRARTDPRQATAD